MGASEFCCCNDCRPPWAFPVPLHPPDTSDQQLARTSIPWQEQGCQGLAGAGRHSSSLSSLPPLAAGYSLSPCYFPVLLAPDFHKTEQRKVLKCRELSRQHAELPPFLPPKILASPPVSSFNKLSIPIPVAHTTVQLSTTSRSLQSNLCDARL